MLDTLVSDDSDALGVLDEQGALDVAELDGSDVEGARDVESAQDVEGAQDVADARDVAEDTGDSCNHPKYCRKVSQNPCNQDTPDTGETSDPN